MIDGAIFESVGKRTVHWLPGVYSRRNTIPSGQGGISNNLVIMGESAGGKPKTLLEASDPKEAKLLLGGGRLLDAVGHAFNGSNDYVPQKVFVMRVNEGQASGLVLKSGTGAPLIELRSADFGAQTNQIKLWIQEGSEANSTKLTIHYKGGEETKDNIVAPSISLIYIGGGDDYSATVSVTKDSIILEALDDTGERVVEQCFEFGLEDCGSLDNLTGRINDTGFWTSTVVASSGNAPASSLDTIGDEPVSCLEPMLLYANFRAVLNALLKLPYIGEAAHVDEATRQIPLYMGNFEYFTGGGAAPATLNDWVEALAVLEEEDVQSIATPSMMPEVHSLISDHAIAMSSTTRRKERQCIFGIAPDTAVVDAISAARGINSEYASLVIDSATATDPFTGETKLIDPGLLSCKIAGMEAAMSVNIPLTNKVLKVKAFGKKRGVPELEKLIQNGIMPCGINENGQLVIIRAMNTYQDSNLGLNERSCVREALFMDRDLRKAYSPRIGTAEEPSESEIVAVLKNKAKEWHTKGYITASDSGDLVFDIKIRFDGDKTYIEYGKFIRAPVNFIFITANNMIYSTPA